MGIIGLVAGVFVLALPHLAAAQTGLVAAWPGLPFPGELLAVILAAVLTSHIPKRFQSRIFPAFVGVSAALAAFEAWSMGQGLADMNSIVVGLIEEVLQGTAFALWLAWLILERADSRGKISVPLYVAAGLAGALWYAGMQELRLLENMDIASIELMSWGITLVWALGAVAFLYRGTWDGTGGSLAAVALFSGVLLGNRGWWILYPLDVRFPVSAYFVAGAAVVLMLVVAIVAWVLPSAGPSLMPASLEEEQSLLDTACLDTSSLTAREREVLELALEGATVDQTAELLGIARSTVASYRSRALSKLGGLSVQDLLVMIRKREGIVSPVDTRDSGAISRQPLWNAWYAAYAALLAIVALAARFLVPQSFVNSLLTLLCVAVFTAGVQGVLRLRHKVSASEISIGLLVGAAGAFVFTGCVFGPQIYLARRVVISVLIAYLLLAVMGSFAAHTHDDETQDTPYHRVRAVALLCAGLVGCALVPPGSHATVILSSAGWATGLAAFALICGELLCVASRKRRLADLANASLAGETRQLAYLQGCGLGELEAKVALLTAQGFSRAQIATALALAPSTVSSYRSSVYAALGVVDKQGLATVLSTKREPMQGRRHE